MQRITSFVKPQKEVYDTFPYKNFINDHIEYFFIFGLFVLVTNFYMIVSNIVNLSEKDNESIKNNKSISRIVHGLSSSLFLLIVFYPFRNPLIVESNLRMMLFLMGGKIFLDSILEIINYSSQK